ncbi:SCO family protein [Agrobacterium rosae]|uniref:SCO family protein n=1 Tax=Agrobacterium rosae TaxID=1972867 RepID=A0AAW9FPV4_9HYPH|nr:SCO family protein [Agrobacterium rosae]MDX8305474.1 SCO family protein [Agrobacterium rosae]
MKGVRIFRIVIWCLVAVVATGLLILGRDLNVRPGNAADASNSSSPAIGKPFSLVSHKGQIVDNGVMDGKPYLAFFGFTHCPDICPTTLFELTDLMAELGSAADKFNVIFISVDPERDTETMLKGYMTSFDPRTMALRGTPEPTATAVKAFAAYSRKVPTEGGNYTIDHTAGVYLMDADGSFKGKLDMHEPREVRLQKIRRLVAGSA